MKCPLFWNQTPKPTSEYRYKKPQFITRGVDRIKRLSYEVLGEHKSKFGEDFANNKKVLDQISIIRSKGLKNEMAGYITKYIKKQIREEKMKQAQRAAAIQEEANVKAQSVEETVDEVDDTEDVIIEASDESETESEENSE